jgi:hypothetical protein
MFDRVITVFFFPQTLSNTFLPNNLVSKRLPLAAVDTDVGVIFLFSQKQKKMVDVVVWCGAGKKNVKVH